VLIDLSQLGAPTLNPLEYPTTLAVRLETGERPACGVFAGRNMDFAPHEEGELVALVGDAEGCRTFLLDRPERGHHRGCSRYWYYVAIGWRSDVYIEHPYVYAMTLQEHDGGPDNYFWAVRVSTGESSRFTLILPDYEPGALARGVVRLFASEPIDGSELDEASIVKIG